jgi:hypothetical protein
LLQRQKSIVPSICRRGTYGGRVKIQYLHTPVHRYLRSIFKRKARFQLHA